MTERREKNLRRLMETTDENTKAKAIDVAINHYLRDLKNKEEIADELDGEHVEALSTTWLPLERPPTTVGRGG